MDPMAWETAARIGYIVAMAFRKRAPRAQRSRRVANPFHRTDNVSSKIALTVIVGVVIVLQLNAGAKEATQTRNAVKLQALQRRCRLGSVEIGWYSAIASSI